MFMNFKKNTTHFKQLKFVIVELQFIFFYLCEILEASLFMSMMTVS